MRCGILCPFICNLQHVQLKQDKKQVFLLLTHKNPQHPLIPVESGHRANAACQAHVHSGCRALLRMALTPRANRRVLSVSAAF